MRGSGNERGILTAARAISGECLSNKWTRDDATLAILIVSDEDNCSNGTGCGNADYKNSSYLTSKLNANARIYGLFKHPSQTRAQCPTAANTAHIYAKAVQDTGGTWGSICDNDYTNTLTSMSSHIAVVLNKNFTLKHKPDSANSLVVKINNAVVNNYQLKGKVIEFTTAPKSNDVIDVSYSYGSSSMAKEFALKHSALRGSVAVKVNGTQLSSNDFSINYNKKKVVLNALPSVGATIAISYLEDKRLNNSWSINTGLKRNSVSCYIENKPATCTVNYTPAAQGFNAEISFNSVPKDNEKIEFKYISAGKQILKYPFILSGEAQNLIAYGKLDKKEIDVTYEKNSVSFMSKDFIENKIIEISYNTERLSLELPQTALKDTVVATSGSKTCDLASGLSFRGQQLDLSKCGFDSGDVSISYDYIVYHSQSYVFDIKDLPDEKEKQAWRVLINGVETKEYTRNANIITLNELPKIGDKITVELTQYK